MILDCTQTGGALTRRLTLAASAGVVDMPAAPARRGDDDALRLRAWRSDHVHFIDGARGGYASAATALKAMAA